MRSASLRLPIQKARPPCEILAALPAACGARILEARAGEGWGTGPASGGRGHHFLAMAPEVEFVGRAEALERARSWLQGYRDALGEAAWLIGSLSYELGFEFEPSGRSNFDSPCVFRNTVDLAGFRALYRFDPDSGRGEVVGSSQVAVQRLAQTINRSVAEAKEAEPVQIGPVSSPTSDSAFLDSIQSILAFIRAGDVYQVNLSRQLESSAPPLQSLRSMYTRLSQRAEAPFSAYLESTRRSVLSASPERFLRVEGGRVETCPIKGTRPRGSTPEADAELAKQLLASGKDRAEHMMIVDLQRNDLGRVCEFGSVKVRRLAELRSYPAVHHLVSSIEGRLRSPSDWPALLRATFPGGSITGAPKLRAMQIIHELEPVPRDVYTGAIGYVDSAGSLDWSIAIRTAVARNRRLSLHLGGGIVADSRPDHELQETRDKGRDFARLWGLRG
ncbi:MAG: anthranilate synthase component I family protein [bacterium]|nr:anthranilate synthase component I family protein [bacterium]